jgi:GNAT superfamily N-acetyltransferase
MRLTRAFAESDLAAVKALVDRTIDVSYAGIYPPAAITFFKEYHSSECILADAQTGYALVIEENGALVATGALLGTNVRRMLVDPAMQGCGLGSALLSSLEEHACHANLTALDLSASLPARDFYLHRGYGIVSEEAILLPEGDKLRFYAMSKALTTG